jgi:hypothetical protein
MSFYGAESTGPADASGVTITFSKTTNALFITKSLHMMFFFHAHMYSNASDKIY